MSLFKSKEQKALEAKLAVRRGIQDLKKCDRSLEKKKEDMIQHAQAAKRQGIDQQFQVAKSGLKMIMAHQKRAQAMILQLQMTESLRDLTSMGAGFVSLLGRVGKEVTKISAAANFAKNQLAFEQGMMAAETAMGQLEDFLEDAGMSFGELTEDDMDAEVERMIDATGSIQQDALDAEIDEKIKALEQKRAALKE